MKVENSLGMARARQSEITLAALLDLLQDEVRVLVIRPCDRMSARSWRLGRHVRSDPAGMHRRIAAILSKRSLWTKANSWVANVWQLLLRSAGISRAYHPVFPVKIIGPAHGFLCQIQNCHIRKFCDKVRSKITKRSIAKQRMEGFF